MRYGRSGVTFWYHQFAHRKSRIKDARNTQLAHHKPRIENSWNAHNAPTQTNGKTHKPEISNQASSPVCIVVLQENKHAKDFKRATYMILKIQYHKNLIINDKRQAPELQFDTFITPSHAQTKVENKCNCGAKNNDMGVVVGWWW